MKKILFITLGCKTNHYDTDVMAGMCSGAGFEIVSDGNDADICVINTCTVTAAADMRGRNLIRCVIRDNPNAIVVVCGCSSQTDADRYKNIEGVDHVLGVRCADELAPLLCKEGRGEVDRDLPHPSSPYKGEGTIQPRARAFLKIQDGCNNRCAYCIVPLARGESKSAQFVDVLNDVRKLLGVGHKEIILTGVHIGRYGKDFSPQTSLAELIQMLLNKTDDCRFRISSLDPDEMGDEMINVLGHPRVCRHVHLSLQSGSDEVLRMMSRKTGIDGYKRMIQKLTDNVHGIAIGADIITGFPGETDEYFEHTLEFVEQLPFAYLHVFPYSPRPETKAASLPNQIPMNLRRVRAKKLLEISAKKRKTFYESQIGKKLDMIIVSKAPDKNGCVKAISDNYVQIFLGGDGLKYREMYKVDVRSNNSNWRRGEGIRGILEAIG